MKRWSCIFLWMLPAFILASNALAMPHRPQVVNGDVQFDRNSPNTLNVTSSPNAIINWQGFSIRRSELTRFIQQGPRSAVFIRVVGSDPSHLLGRLQSNGRVFLTNSHGIVFGPDSNTDIAGLVASTLDLTDQDFLAGKLRFSGGLQSGSIVIQDFIGAGRDGDIYLIAPRIENSGIIQTDGGNLLLAAGERLTVNSPDLKGVDFEVQTPDQEVLNLGRALANGGVVAMFAGTVRHAGEIRVDTLAVDETGSVILAAAEDVLLEDGSVVSASGDPGGVHDGGEVRIVAENTLNMQAGAEVRVHGGADGGDGGFLELSGRQRIFLDGTYTGFAHVPGFGSGSLLIDPVDIRIGFAGPSNATAAGYLGDNGLDGLIDAADPGDVDAACDAGGEALCITTHALAGGGWLDVHLQASGTISVEVAIADADIPDGGALTLEADQIAINADIGSSGTRFDHTLNIMAADTITVDGSVYISDPADNPGAPDRHDLLLIAGTGIDLASGARLDMAAVQSFGQVRIEVTGTDGAINVAPGATISYTGPPSPGALVTLRANDIELQGSIDALPSGVNLHTASAGRPIDLGSETAGSLSLTEAELNRIFAADIRVGRFDSGNLVVSAPVDLTTTSTMLTGVRSTLVVVPGASLSATGGLYLDASDFDIQGFINAGFVRLSPGCGSGVTAIELGTSGPGAGVAAIDQSELDRISASGRVEIGAWCAPDIVVTAPIDVRASIAPELGLQSDYDIDVDAPLTAVSIIVRLDAGQTMTVGDGAMLSAGGVILGDLVSSGRLLPGGEAPGTLEVTGALTLVGPNALVEIDLGGTAQGFTYDHIQVEGTASLGGILKLTFLENFQPSTGEIFEILSTSTAGGKFDGLNFPVFSGGVMDVEYFVGGSSGVRVYEVPRETEPGNVNGDPDIDLKDAIIALQILSGSPVSGVNDHADVVGNRKIGMPEVLYILQHVGSMR